MFANGGRASRFGDFTVVYLHRIAFVTTPLELRRAQSWARGRSSTGNRVRDRVAFTDRFETLIARTGSGMKSKGRRVALQRMVKSMKANAVPMESWSIPRDLFRSVEIKRPPPKKK